MPHYGTIPCLLSVQRMQADMMHVAQRGAPPDGQGRLFRTNR
jgi:hypothetical protein